MKDRRSIKKHHEVEEALSEISDTEILINFSNALRALYPNLITVNAFAYDSWDDIVEPLFYQLVYRTFAYKYGIKVLKEESHIYNYVWFGGKKKKKHIECRPISLPLNVLINGSWDTFRQDDLLNKTIIFRAFGDGEHFLTGGLGLSEANNVNFDLAEIILFDDVTGVSSFHERTISVRKEDLFYEFVMEI